MGQRANEASQGCASILVALIRTKKVPCIGHNPLMWGPGGTIRLRRPAPLRPDIGHGLREFHVDLREGRSYKNEPCGMVLQ